MSSTLIALLIVLLATAALGVWLWRNQRRLNRLDQRVRRQTALIEEIDSVLENPQLSDEEQRIKSEVLLAKLKASNKR
ncbi:hypothetical protein [Pseudomonas zhanjiangensis]|uniref:Phage shock protein B n=1 Tax=Pseudomonas zhanjiangensis TaxID=3239015 RepID=A0ABV3YRR3_9PSED